MERDVEREPRTGLARRAMECARAVRGEGGGHETRADSSPPPVAERFAAAWRALQDVRSCDLDCVREGNSSRSGSMDDEARVQAWREAMYADGVPASPGEGDPEAERALGGLLDPQAAPARLRDALERDGQGHESGSAGMLPRALYEARLVESQPDAHAVRIDELRRGRREAADAWDDAEAAMVRANYAGDDDAYHDEWERREGAEGARELLDQEEMELSYDSERREADVEAVAAHLAELHSDGELDPGRAAEYAREVNEGEGWEYEARYPVCAGGERAGERAERVSGVRLEGEDLERAVEVARVRIEEAREERYAEIQAELDRELDDVAEMERRLREAYHPRTIHEEARARVEVAMARCEARMARLGPGAGWEERRRAFDESGVAEALEGARLAADREPW